jgi:hypothetical protein
MSGQVQVLHLYLGRLRRKRKLESKELVDAIRWRAEMLEEWMDRISEKKQEWMVIVLYFKRYRYRYRSYRYK